MQNILAMLIRLTKGNKNTSAAHEIIFVLFCFYFGCLFANLTESNFRMQNTKRWFLGPMPIFLFIYFWSFRTWCECRYLFARWSFSRHHLLISFLYFYSFTVLFPFDLYLWKRYLCILKQNCHAMQSPINFLHAFPLFA